MAKPKQQKKPPQKKPQNPQVLYPSPSSNLFALF